MPDRVLPDHLEWLLESLAGLKATAGLLPDSDTPAGMLTREFLYNNWATCADGLLAKTKVLRITPEHSAAPSIFEFQLDRPYKRKRANQPVELTPGPIRGRIHYRPDMFVHPNPDEPHIAVQLDPRQAFFHPNVSRRRGGLVCLGSLPSSPFPFPLDLLLEDHLYPILTYQNRRPSDPFDREAAEYFALDPHAMDGLQPVDPLY